MSYTLPEQDLHYVLEHTAPLWEAARGERLFLTGGTGFIGRWLVESFLCANQQLDLRAQLTILSRRARESSNAAVQFLQNDIRTFAFPEGKYRLIIHGATDVVPASTDPAERLDLFDVITQGTRRVLDFARSAGTQRLLLLSSGAVYGTTPHHPVEENFSGAPSPNDRRCEYGEGKRVAELLCWLTAQQHNFTATSARLFALIGPGLPLNSMFAAGNFIRDAVQGRPVHVDGDGSAVRSYLYTADMAIWLWTLLFRGASQRAYNVGSEAPISIAALAKTVADELNAGPVEIAGSPAAATNYYIPSTARARTELSLSAHIPLREAIRRTAAWARQTQNRAS